MEKDNTEALKSKFTEDQIRAFVDEQTVFAMASLMLDIHTHTMLKNKNGVANAFLKAGVVLKNNPGFVGRFKMAQEAIIKEMQKSGPPKSGITPLPTDIALGIVRPKQDPTSPISTVLMDENENAQASDI